MKGAPMRAHPKTVGKANKNPKNPKIRLKTSNLPTYIEKT
jgi:hypothetical protein